jgi:hypothetical protein
MTSEREFNALLRSWFEESAPSGQPQGLLESVLTATAHTRPRPAWLVGLRGKPMPETGRSGLNRFASLALVATVVVVAILIGIGILVRPPNVGPSPVPGPTHSVTAEPSASEAPARAASWTATGNMIEARGGYAGTLLKDGKVLVAGGNISSGDSASAELYDPSSGTWAATGNMVTAMSSPTAAMLLKDGRVLVIGSGSEGSAELYDPTSGTWTATGNMVTGHFGYAATLLSDGRVLVASENYNPGVDPVSAELYDPARGTWTATGGMIAPRFDPAATLLDDGRVLVAGGATGGDKTYLASAEVYDPASGTWTATGDMAVGRGDFTASLLTDGHVLVVGGLNHNGGGIEWASAELYDPVSGTWTATGNMGEARYAHRATLLLDGRVLVAGGFNTDLSGLTAPLASAELYDPSSGSWSPTANAIEARAGAAATLLPDGTVLVAGGFFDINETPVSTVELYHPGSGS